MALNGRLFGVEMDSGLFQSENISPSFLSEPTGSPAYAIVLEHLFENSSAFCVSVTKHSRRETEALNVVKLGHAMCCMNDLCSTAVGFTSP